MLMRVIGITGGIGSGKSAVSSYLSEKGFRVLDADAISRKLTGDGSPVLREIADAFGNDLIKDGNTLDRKALAEIVFSDAGKRKTLESIVTSRVLKLMDEELSSERSAGTEVVFLDVPLLFETGCDNKCDEVWVVTADREVRISRVSRRDGMNREKVIARMDSQMPEEEKTARADEIIDNSGTLRETRAVIDKLLSKKFARKN